MDSSSQSCSVQILPSLINEIERHSIYFDTITLYIQGCTNNTKFAFQKLGLVSFSSYSSAKTSSTAFLYINIETYHWKRVSVLPWNFLTLDVNTKLPTLVKVSSHQGQILFSSCFKWFYELIAADHWLVAAGVFL